MSIRIIWERLKCSNIRLWQWLNDSVNYQKWLTYTLQVILW